MIKLYETNSYLKECETIVKSAYEKDGAYYITLEETIFFPEEGGQYADTGVIIVSDNGVTHNIQLLDGQIASGDIVYKIESGIGVGTRVKCVLDFDKRYDRMQNHSGEHLLTGVIHNKYGYVNKGFHLSDDSFVTLDISGPMTYEEVMEMEKEANILIYKNLPIVDSYPTDEELKNITYRSKIEIEGQVRLITIGDENDTVDICACCAPHVARTGEIGIIKVTGVVNWKGGVRVSMLAGRRALEYINEQQDIIKALTDKFTTSPDNISNVFDKKLAEIGEIKQKLDSALQREAIGRLDNLLNNNISNTALFVSSDMTNTAMKVVFNYMLEKVDGYAGVFAGDDENGYRYMAGGRDRDARVIAGALREKYGAKGGGKPDAVQGQVQAKEVQISDLFSQLV